MLKPRRKYNKTQIRQDAYVLQKQYNWVIQLKKTGDFRMHCSSMYLVNEEEEGKWTQTVINECSYIRCFGKPLPSANNKTLIKI